MNSGHKMQKLIDGVWVDFVGDMAGGFLISNDINIGDVYRIPVGGQIIDDVLVGNGWDQKTYTTPSVLPTLEPVKMVGMGDLGELLPDIVLVELIDYSNDKTAAQAIRNGATRIMVRVNSNQNVDVLDPSFISLLQALVSFTSLTTEQATDIFNELK